MLGLVSSVPCSVIGCEAFPWNDLYWVTWNVPWALVDVDASCRVDRHGQCRRSAPDIPLNADTHRRFTIYQHLAFHVEIYEINLIPISYSPQWTVAKRLRVVAAWKVKCSSKRQYFFLSKSTKNGKCGKNFHMAVCIVSLQHRAYMYWDDRTGLFA